MNDTIETIIITFKLVVDSLAGVVLGLLIWLAALITLANEDLKVLMILLLIAGMAKIYKESRRAMQSWEEER